ncbi:CbiQ family ECF transporter T component [Corynebacterium otitidis]|uniref:Putative secreted protein n=1 Tax=Corynebacterium otitidis ATCC 51513 TaxID=883169 RepID=I7KJN8_9CORY|nr:CbiQ family ECF transporter T component [Corynebacterium otitidis]EJZ81857.1 hypothetical protein HMPREF9719_01232 [Corynebacterium otitidis ATCC 51513]CCI83740.1 putative secreted protein [Corynebacterium otitidis ATCC 51513]
MAARLNPLTWLAAAAAAWLLVLGLNDWRVSLAVAAGFLILAGAARGPAPVAAALALAAPVGASLVIVHGPHGERDLGILSSEGLAVAGTLSVRVLALIAALLAAGALIPVPALVKALGRYPRAAYLAGAALRLFPQAAGELTSIREANRLRGRRVRGPVAAAKHLAVPLIVRLVSAGADRVIPLEVAGLVRPGRRTVLVPPDDSAWQRAARVALLVLAAGAVVLWRW